MWNTLGDVRRHGDAITGSYPDMGADLHGESTVRTADREGKMERSVKGASVLAIAAAILAGGAATASAAPVTPQVFCQVTKAPADRTSPAQASLVKISDHELAAGAAVCSQGTSN
jgi:hypothetical protein